MRANKLCPAGRERRLYKSSGEGACGAERYVAVAEKGGRGRKRGEGGEVMNGTKGRKREGNKRRR